MNPMLKVLYILTACIALGGATDTRPDVDGGNVLVQGFCFNHGARYLCFVVEKKGVKYLAMHDSKGEAFIYRIVLMPEDPNELDDTHLSLLWSRDSF